MEYNIVNGIGPNGYFRINLNSNIFTFYDFGGYEDRNSSTIKLIINALKENEEIFLNKEIDCIVNTTDHLNDSYLSYAHPSDKYKTIPCFTFDAWKQIGIDSFESMVYNIKEKANQPYIINGLFWGGSINPNIIPRCEYQKIANNNQIICENVEFDRSNPQKLTASNFTSLPDHAKYKYLIDLEGMGWSGRLKFLCFTKRVLFINKRPHMEWWMHDLKDFHNCIMVERNLEDLIEKFNYIENNPHLYNNIANNLYEFACDNLTINNVNSHIIKTFKKLI